MPTAFFNFAYNSTNTQPDTTLPFIALIRFFVSFIESNFIVYWTILQISSVQSRLVLVKIHFKLSVIARNERNHHFDMSNEWSHIVRTIGKSQSPRPTAMHWRHYSGICCMPWRVGRRLIYSVLFSFHFIHEFSLHFNSTSHSLLIHHSHLQLCYLLASTHALEHNNNSYDQLTHCTMQFH